MRDDVPVAKNPELSFRDASTRATPTKRILELIFGDRFKQQAYSLSRFRSKWIFVRLRRPTNGSLGWLEIRQSKQTFDVDGFPKQKLKPFQKAREIFESE